MVYHQIHHLRDHRNRRSGFGLALLVQKSGVVVQLCRTAFVLPMSIGLASAALLWGWLYHPSVGIFSALARATGLSDGPVAWLDSPQGALWAIIIMILWKYAGFNMLILLVGLQSIPAELYEAARVDGASWLRQMWHITLPLLRNTFALLLALSLPGSFLAFDQFFIMTGGGPNNSTITLVFSVYRAGFVSFDLGYAAALALLLMTGLLILNLSQISALRRKGD